MLPGILFIATFLGSVASIVLAANVATGVLVIGASRLGVPVSTTHVSVGALFGIGLTTGQADLAVMRNVVLSWLFTLPCAASLAAGGY